MTSSMGRGMSPVANEKIKPIINNIFDFSAEALGQLRTWLEQNPPAISITQIIGFTQFTVQAATPVTTNESTTSLTYVDLATAGPTLTGLPGGKYLVILIATMSSSVNTIAALMSPSVNGATPVDTQATYTANIDAASLVGLALISLPVGSNTIQAKYKVSAAGTGLFANRNMIALKYANA